MDKNIIVGMLSDPNIDPTGWVGEALVIWVMNNAKVCLQTPEARPYIFNAMNDSDASYLCKTVLSIAKEEGEYTIIKDYIKSCNKINITSWVGNTIDSELCKALKEDYNILDIILQFKLPYGSYTDYAIVSRLENLNQIETLLTNRKLDYHRSSWQNLVKLIPKEELGRMFKTHIGQQLKNVSLDPSDTQLLLEIIAMLLPRKDWPIWIEWIRETNVSKLWVNSSELLSKKRDRTEIYFDQTICRCGFASANKSGLKNHKAKCTFSSSIPLYLLANILDAEINNKHYCKKCGKICATKSGLMLHHKTCNKKKDLFGQFIHDSSAQKDQAKALRLRREVLRQQRKEKYEN